jgi:5,5'-dehydrodivanillate O-demethylase
MSEDLTLYRGESGTPYAVAFRCAHRGTQLSTGWVEGEHLRCFYHGWAYDGSGQCIEQPAEPESFCQRIRIRSYPAEEYLGLIFVYLGEGEPPPLPRYPEIDGDPTAFRELHTYTWPCNYFNSLENDPYHGLWVHRDAYEAAGRAAAGIPEVRVVETDYGYATYSTRRSGRTTVNHRLMPNIVYGRRTAVDLEPGAWRDSIMWRVPVDDGHFTSFGVHLTHGSAEATRRAAEVRRILEEEAKTLVAAEVLGEAVLRGDLRIEDIVDRHRGGRLFNIQDYCSQVAQGVIADREHEHLGREDETLILQRTIWRRELRALAEGRPLKPWQRSGPLLVGATEGW